MDHSVPSTLACNVEAETCSMLSVAHEVSHEDSVIHGELSTMARVITPHTPKRYMETHCPEMDNRQVVPTRSCTPTQCTPIGYTDTKHIPIRYADMECTPIGYADSECTQLGMPICTILKRIMPCRGQTPRQTVQIHDYHMWTCPVTRAKHGLCPCNPHRELKGPPCPRNATL